MKRTYSKPTCDNETLRLHDGVLQADPQVVTGSYGTNFVDANRLNLGFDDETDDQLGNKHQSNLWDE